MGCCLYGSMTRRLLNPIHNKTRDIKQLAVILQLAGKHFPASHPHGHPWFDSGLCKKSGHIFVIPHGLVGQGKIGHMDQTCPEGAVRAHLPVFIANHERCLPILPEDQDCFLKPGLKSCQVCEVPSMLPVPINRQCIHCPRFHPGTYLLEPFVPGIRCQVYRNQSHTGFRRGHCPVCYFNVFRIHPHLLYPATSGVMCSG